MMQCIHTYGIGEELGNRTGRGDILRLSESSYGRTGDYTSL